VSADCTAAPAGKVGVCTANLCSYVCASGTTQCSSSGACYTPSASTCDNGAANGTGVGQCNPDCSGVVAVKHVRLTPAVFTPGSSFASVLGADALCAGQFGAGYKAFIVDGVTRRATVTGLQGDGQIGWVLSKFTQYVDSGLDNRGALPDLPIWTTDRSALLGVTNGAAGVLLNPIEAVNDGQGAWGGMLPNYVTESDCLHWTSSAATDSGRPILPSFTDVNGRFPNNGGISACSFPRHLVCVEQ
jgi:hypothetical protein